MSTVINQNLFRHHDTRSAAFNNLCTVIHRLAEEGDYLGEVVSGKRLLGTFRLRHARAGGESQVNIDLSWFDEVFAANTPRGGGSREYTVGQDGYVVFHVSGHHTGLYVTLTRIQEKKTAPSFDSRKLGKGDILALRLWNPGAYTVINEPGGQQATITVRGANDGKTYEPSKLQPINVTLTEKGFNPETIDQAAFQALIINLETSAALIVKHEKRPTKGT
jgi:hypothetical protein